MDYINDPDFLDKIHRYWEMLDDMVKNQPEPDDDELVEQTIIDLATGETTTRTMRYGDIEKEMEKKYREKYGVIQEEDN